MEMEGKVRYAARTLSKRPEWHSAMKEARSLDSGVRRSAWVESDCQAEWAWSMGPSRRIEGRGIVDGGGGGGSWGSNAMRAVG